MADPSPSAAAARRLRVREPAAPCLPRRLVAATGSDADLRDDAVRAGLAVDGLDLSGQEAAGAELDQCRYRDVSLGQVRLNRTTISDVEFSDCDLANLRARDSSMRRVVLSGTRMTGLTWITGSIRDAVFSNCRIDLGFFSATRFSDVVFLNCRLDQANFGDTSLSDVLFVNCDLTGAQFSGASLAGTRFSGCLLAGISGVASLRGAIISTCDAVALAAIFAEALGIVIDDG